jgi:translation initiation factor IF-1
MSEKKDFIELRGTVVSVLGNGNFKVKVFFDEKKQSEVLARVAGRLRKGGGKFIRIVEGDEVQVEISPYDITRGRIVYRFSDNIYRS